LAQERQRRASISRRPEPANDVGDPSLRLRVADAREQRERRPRSAIAEPRCDDLARTADLALASVASHVAAGDPARADAIAQSYEDRLRAATDPSDVVSTLAALGNTRSPRILDAASAYLNDDDALVRRMAAHVLGQSPDAEATAVLERLSASDEDPRVRAEATRALARRNPS
jgi:HEAT repeat protein